MLNILGNDGQRRCDGITRRNLLQIGSLGAAGLTLPDWLRWQSHARAEDRPARDTAVILIWLDGGPSHLDTYDFKPDAPAEFRGPFQPIQTRVPGINICDLLPMQARIMDRLAVVRSLCHTTLDHYAGQNWLLTGHLGPNVLRQEPVYPSAGAITAKLRGPNRPGLPAYVGVPIVTTTFMPAPGYHGGGFLGSAFDPFQTGSDPNSSDFSVPNLKLESVLSGSTSAAPC